MQVEERDQCRSKDAQCKDQHTRGSKVIQQQFLQGLFGKIASIEEGTCPASLRLLKELQPAEVSCRLTVEHEQQGANSRGILLSN
jgi:hypothetical protein